MEKLNYEEGTAFLIPRKDGSFTRGVIARHSPNGGTVFCYFFGPSVSQNNIQDFEGLNVQDAILSARVGNLGLTEGHWPIVGKLPNWDRSQWPMTQAIRRDPLNVAKPILVTYSNNDPKELIKEESLDFLTEEQSNLPEDGLAGQQFIEEVLEKIDL